MPSLKQLNEAIASYHADHPEALMTVVVDATFGHRIDPKESAEFETAIETNSFVAPPAGAVGRGDGFILSIAQKANASILSNDSYQEFHGEYAWLFDEGRLIGGKPVPHVGWVWVNRVPVRGPVSRRSVKEQKIVEKSSGRRRGSKASELPSISADAPMPIPSAPPPGAVLPGQKERQRGNASTTAAEPVEQNATTEQSGKRGGQRRGDGRRAEQPPKPAPVGEQPKADASKTTNDLLAFLSFVEHFPVGTAVTGVVETYSSHGAYVLIGDVHGYVPLRLMADPAPRSAREVMDLGETVTLVVSSFGAARRSIDLAVPSMAPVTAPPAPARGSTKKAPRKSVAQKAAAAAEAVAAEAIAADVVPAPVAAPSDAPTMKPSRRRSPKKGAQAEIPDEPVTAAARRRRAPRAQAAAAPPVEPPSPEP
ncbi:MAG: hypothetical protein JWN62_2455, partial [Acidimicrobiales bacterium]|nr:hypothetical protein [Acidimicrobiales bacterium]